MPSKVQIIQGNAITIPLPDGVVQLCVTSVPYFQQRSYLPKEHPLKDKEIGQENDPDAFVADLMLVTAEIWRVLRMDGVFVINISDTFSGSGKGVGHGKQKSNPGSMTNNRTSDMGVRNKSLFLIPDRLRLALQKQGWIIRNNCAWIKDSPMPESVRDRFTRAHEDIVVCTKSEHYYWDADAIATPAKSSSIDRLGRGVDDNKWTEGAPGQTKHTMNKPRKNVRFGGNRGVNRLQSGKEWSPKVAAADPTVIAAGATGIDDRKSPELYVTANARDWMKFSNPGLRGHQHYAAYPVALPELFIKAATSERGCCSKCGKPYVRVTEKQSLNPWGERKEAGATTAGSDHPGNNHGEGKSHDLGSASVTTGWRQSCRCKDAGDPVPCLILDPFTGSSSSLIAARKLGRHGIGIDLSYAYCQIGQKRLKETAKTHRNRLDDGVQLALPLDATPAKEKFADYMQLELAI